MKISEVTTNDLIEYARETADSEVTKTFGTILLAAKSYIRNYTGLTVEQMDAKEDLTIALMVLANEMYENRVFTVQDNKVNVVIKSILDMHSINLL
ncbi:head-tail connector protein [Metabacillus sp. B2-18]|uniref:head-tail connector protein n=1 Tax=Metabacillus sp. B2-18 TaxID=2897333 RepID=UPI001E4C7A16|nr:head-tail connector protein [Metabacillus sp. B2-18]UGB31703.1 head-tail connector protein [Metabacillus sp. B2-18]